MANLVKPRTTVKNVRPTVHRTTTGSSFQYRPPSAEELKERAQRKGNRDSFFEQSVQFFTPKANDNAVRMLPPPPDRRDAWKAYGVTLHVHYGIGPDEAAYLCLDKMRGEPCPVCEERARAKAAGEEELAQELRVATRLACYIIDRDQEGKGPLIWNMPASIDSDICGRAVNKRTGEVYCVDDPENGFDITFTREGVGMTTKYKSIEIARDSTPLSEDPSVAQKWLEFICANAIDAKLVYHTYDHIRSALYGSSAAVQPAAAEEETVSKILPRVQVRGKPAPAKEESPFSDKPTWVELQQLSEDDIGAMGEDFKLTFPEEGFNSVDELRIWVAKQLDIEIPEAAPPASTAGKSWRDKLHSATSK